MAEQKIVRTDNLAYYKSLQDDQYNNRVDALTDTIQQFVEQLQSMFGSYVDTEELTALLKDYLKTQEMQVADTTDIDSMFEA